MSWTTYDQTRNTVRLSDLIDDASTKMLKYLELFFNPNQSAFTLWIFDEGDLKCIGFYNHDQFEECFARAKSSFPLIEKVFKTDKTTFVCNQQGEILFSTLR